MCNVLCYVMCYVVCNGCTGGSSVGLGQFDGHGRQTVNQVECSSCARSHLEKVERVGNWGRGLISKWGERVG